jgi:hypothetical protein
MSLKPFQINNLITGFIIEPLLKFAIEQPKLLYDNIDVMLETNYSHKFDDIILILLKSGYKLKPTQIKEMIKMDCCTLYVIEQIGITTEIIDMCCLHCNINGLQYIFDNKITPTREMFIMLFNRLNCDINVCIDLFKNYGYIINYDDFILLTKNKIQIDCNNLEHFLTNDFHKICDEIQFYPKYYKPTIIYLRNCAKKIHNIKSFETFKSLLRPDLQPDIECLINACEFSCMSILRFLIEKCNLIPNNECLKRSLINNKQQREYIINKYIEHHPNQ